MSLASYPHLGIHQGYIRTHFCHFLACTYITCCDAYNGGAITSQLGKSRNNGTVLRVWNRTPVRIASGGTRASSMGWIAAACCAIFTNAIPQTLDLCLEWQSREVFLEWAETNGWRPGLTMIRIDENKGYGPWNCLLVTHAEAQRKISKGCLTDEQAARAKKLADDRQKTGYVMGPEGLDALCVWMELGFQLKPQNQ